MRPLRPLSAILGDASGKPDMAKTALWHDCLDAADELHPLTVIPRVGQPVINWETIGEQFSQRFHVMPHIFFQIMRPSGRNWKDDMAYRLYELIYGHDPTSDWTKCYQLFLDPNVQEWIKQAVYQQKVGAALESQAKKAIDRALA